MGKPLSQAKIDRIRRLCEVHTMTAVAEIVGTHRSVIRALRQRGWKAGHQEHRPRPSDFALVCDTMTIAEMCQRYRASDHTVRRWANEIGRSFKRTCTRKPRPIPDDLAKMVAELGPYGAADHYGVSYGTVKRWRKAMGLPLSWSRRPKSERTAPTMVGWADRYFQERRAA